VGEEGHAHVAHVLGDLAFLLLEHVVDEAEVDDEHGEDDVDVDLAAVGVGEESAVGVLLDGHLDELGGDEGSGGGGLESEDEVVNHGLDHESSTFEVLCIVSLALVFFSEKNLLDVLNYSGISVVGGQPESC
jgi:hypothetical protein